ncbi:MAG: hypothetical protein IJT30_06890 [Muribaculaceae bacterium]|nr:hypothetical protein [Muribaculaceae bacterium]
MTFSPYVISLLQDKSAIDCSSPSAAEMLSLDIERVTGERLGVNTLKRLLGRLDECEPREATLNIIARYLGFPNWSVIERIEAHRCNSDFATVYRELRTTRLAPGQRVAITYLPDRRVVMECAGRGRYCVTESINSKLRPGDQLSLPILVDGFPLIAHDVVRNNQPMGTFTAGKEHGIHWEIET